MTDHTPTPWSLVDRRIVGPQGELVVRELRSCSTGDADLIVRAVNAYEPMQQALGQIMAETDPMATERPRPIRLHELARIALEVKP